MTISRRLSPHCVTMSSSVDHQTLKRSSNAKQPVLLESAQSTKKKKSVQFTAAIDRNFGNDKEKCFQSSYDIPNDTFKNELWWSQEELKIISEEKKQLIRKFITEQTEKQQGDRDAIEKNFVALYRSCASMSVSQVLRSKNTKELFLEVSNTDCLRGLENSLSKTISRQRKYHLQSILDTLDNVTDVLDDSVGIKSAQSSRASQIFARVLAQVDAKEGATQ